MGDILAKDKNSELMELVNKAIDSLTFADGGFLNPKQQANFIKYVQKFSTMLSLARIVPMGDPTLDIDKAWLGRPITRAHGENQDAAADEAGIDTNQVRLTASKVKSYWPLTTEALQNQIERERLESSVQMMMLERIATDFEHLFINGDVSRYAADTSDTGWLLRRADGILKLGETGHIANFAGQYITRAVFREIRKMVPKEYLKTKNLAFFLPDSLWVDYVDTLADRGTAAGDRALEGNVVSPYGYPIVSTELFPTDDPITVTNSTSAIVTGTEFQPFAVGTGNTLKIDIDNVAAVTITLTDNTLNVSEVAQQISDAIYNDANYQALANKELYRYVAHDDGFGRLVIESPTTGATSEVDIQAVANDAYTLLGLTAAVTTGSNAGTSSSVNEGAKILFTSPNNLIMGILDGTRVYSTFNARYDRIETYVYNQLAIAIENVDGLVLGVDVRVKPV